MKVKWKKQTYIQLNQNVKLKEFTKCAAANELNVSSTNE
jgi:hypothetical protein